MTVYVTFIHPYVVLFFVNNSASGK